MTNQSSYKKKYTIVFLSNSIKHTLEGSERRQEKHCLDSLLIVKLSKDVDFGHVVDNFLLSSTIISNLELFVELLGPQFFVYYEFYRIQILSFELRS